MRLPNATLREAKIIMLANGPWLLNIIHVKSNHIAVFRVRVPGDIGIDSLEPQRAHLVGMIMQEGSPDESGTTIEEPEDQRWQEEALQLLPMTPAGSNEDHSEDIVSFAEGLIASHPDTPRCAKDKQQEKQDHSDNTPDNIGLRDKFNPNRWLWLVKSQLDNTPHDRMKRALHKDDVSQPAVQKIEALIRQPGDHGKERLSTAQHHRERKQGVSENANPIGPWSNTGSGIIDAIHARHRGDPGVIDDANEAEDRKIAGQSGKNEDL